jgi:hypothetical protein
LAATKQDGNEWEPPVDFVTKGYHNMIAKSLLSKGNNKRLKAAMEKAERGDDVTIAYIGGSITQGTGAQPIHTTGSIQLYPGWPVLK